MKLREPITPKDPNGPLRVIGIGRISTEHQPLTNLDASKSYVDRYISSIYQGPSEMTFLGERASGMLVDRATIVQAMELIATGTFDLVIAEDLSRIYRNPQFQFMFVHTCIDFDTRLICIGDNLDTAEENWEVALGTASLRHGLHIPDTRRRVRRTATESFNNGGMVQKVRFGYRKLTKEEATSGQFGRPGLRIAKQPEYTEIVMLMREMILAREEISGRVVARWEFEDVADWLYQHGIPAGPYVKSGVWTGTLVKEFLLDDILWGMRRFRQTKYEPNYSKGGSKRKKNASPENRHYETLAHMTKEEHDLLKVEILRREAERKRGDDFVNHLRGKRRSDSYFPAQHAVCVVCGDVMHRYDNDQLKCSNAHRRDERRCWCHVQVSCSLVRDRFFTWLDQLLVERPPMRDVVIDAALEEFQQIVSRSRCEAAGTENEIRRLEEERSNLVKAIRKGGNLRSLVKELADIEQGLDQLRNANDVAAGTGNNPLLSLNRQELDCQLKHVLVWLAENSYEFARLMRRLIPEFVIQPVQALDTGLVRPRARFIVDFGRFCETPGTIGQAVRPEDRVETELDLFDPPEHIKHLQACIDAKRQCPDRSLKIIAAEISAAKGEHVGHMTVKRAFAYAHLMDAEGLSTPYRVLNEQPQNASRWKRRKKGKRTATPTPGEFNCDGALTENSPTPATLHSDETGPGTPHESAA